jgi:hypothetical protein
MVSITDVASMLGRDFAEYTFLPAQGMRGGILMAWRPDCIKIGTYSVSLHSVTVKVRAINDNPWWFTGVYGPQIEVQKIEFLEDQEQMPRAMISGR